MTGLIGIVENLRGATVARRGARLALRDRHRCDLGPLHAQEMDEVAVCVDDSDVHFPIALFCLGFSSRQNLLRLFRSDRRPIRYVERHGIGSPARRWICWRLLCDRLAAHSSARVNAEAIETNRAMKLLPTMLLRIIAGT